MSEFKQFDTQALTIYMVRLSGDAKVFPRQDGKGNDVILSFADNSRIKGTETLWVDAKVAPFQAERSEGYRKGDEVQVTGKLRFKLGDDGKLRGKMYDATVSSFVKLSERVKGEPTGTVMTRPEPSGAFEPAGAPAFE